MCYSAQIEASYQTFVHEFGAVIDIHQFVKLFVEKRGPGWNKLPKAMRDSFRKPENEAGFELAKLVADGDREYEERLQAELVVQEDRLAKATDILASPRPTKKAADDARIASNKVKAARRNLEDLRRHQAEPKDSRIYPGSYAPVLIRNPQTGQRTVIPMRYQCRLAGKPIAYDRKYPGTTFAPLHLTSIMSAQVSCSARRSSRYWDRR